ncbi:MAG: imidazole glycerol phosphate synthase subunit HisH [Oscillatoria sp. SIO1A7]|nr:imidazole glycerol phosphate synthase subunit HisH [Oscillatoria sp. SIO1A7]
MIGIVDYGMGNLLSVYNALEMVGADVQLCPEPKQLQTVERIVLPGVGAFRDCMVNLKKKGFVEALEDAVLGKSKPILGICLGMQAMARRSFEGGEYQGLGWIDADVVRLQPNDSLRVPQIGWNDIIYQLDSPLFSSLPPAPDFYFVHSYYMKCHNEINVDATCDYGGLVTVAIRKGNIFATQFHPEKSQEYGLKILENFLQWNP